MKETLRLTIRQDGSVVEQVEGVYGTHCENLTSNIEKQLGSVSFKEQTSDYYRTDKNKQEQHVTL